MIEVRIRQEQETESICLPTITIWTRERRSFDYLLYHYYLFNIDTSPSNWKYPQEWHKSRLRTTEFWTPTKIFNFGAKYSHFQVGVVLPWIAPQCYGHGDETRSLPGPFTLLSSGTVRYRRPSRCQSCQDKTNSYCGRQRCQGLWGLVPNQTKTLGTPRRGIGCHLARGEWRERVWHPETNATGLDTGEGCGAQFLHRRAENEERIEIEQLLWLQFLLENHFW